MAKPLGQATPYGVYALTANEGGGSVGTEHATAQFAVETLRRGWGPRGSSAYPQAEELLLTAAGGGSNGSRSRLWKLELQRLAAETGLASTVWPFPPGTSKGHKIEHRMFCPITEPWRGRPLSSQEVSVNLSANTTPATGLRIRAARDTKASPTGLKVPQQQMQELRLQPASFHGKDWNYTLTPGSMETR